MFKLLRSLLSFISETVDKKGLYSFFVPCYFAIHVSQIEVLSKAGSKKRFKSGAVRQAIRQTDKQTYRHINKIELRMRG